MSTQRAALTCLGVAFFAAACSTVPNQPYQVRLAPHGADSLVLSLPLQPRGYELAVVEFDDQGDLWSETQFRAALGSIDDAKLRAEQRGDRGAVVVVFIHGWKHNASPDDGNLRSFQQTLQQIAADDAEFVRHANEVDPQLHLQTRPLLGIYVGWRGAALDVALGDWVSDAVQSVKTYYDRSAAARRVGGVTATRVLGTIFTRAKAGSPQTTTIAVGHSMGGLILEHSMIDYLAGLVITGTATGSAVPSPADLIVMVNPAAPALETYLFLQVLKQSKLQMSIQQENAFNTYMPDAARRAPLLVAVGSSHDTANRLAFPIGAGLRARKQFFRAGPLAELSGSRQKDLYTHSTGFAEPLRSHLLRVTPTASTAPRRTLAPCSEGLFRSTPDTVLCFTVDRGETSETARQLFRLIDVAVYNDTPYWVISVDEGVIPGHSEIFEVTFQDFLRGMIYFVTGRDARQPKAPPRELITPPLEASAARASYRVVEDAEEATTPKEIPEPAPEPTPEQPPG